MPSLQGGSGPNEALLAAEEHANASSSNGGGGGGGGGGSLGTLAAAAASLIIGGGNSNNNNSNSYNNNNNARLFSSSPLGSSPSANGPMTRSISSTISNSSHHHLQDHIEVLNSPSLPLQPNSPSSGNSSPTSSSLHIHHLQNTQIHNLHNHRPSINASYSADLGSLGLFKLPRFTNRSILTSTIDLCNTILGTGMVSLPFAFSTVGLGVGTVFVAIAVWVTWFTLRLLVTSAQKAHGNPQQKYSWSLNCMRGEPSFSSIAQVTLSPFMAAVVDSVVVLACLGFSISYLVSIGECMPALVQGLISADHPAFWILGNRYFWMVAFIGIIAPLCFAHSVDDFYWFSITALGCAVYLAICIIVQAFLTQNSPTTLPISWIVWERKSFDCIPIFVFAFTCHQNIFSIYKEIEANYMTGEALDYGTLSHIHSVIDLSVICVGTVYLIVGWIGFLMFGNATKIIILDNYAPSHSITIARVMYSLLAALSIPIQHHPCRVALESLLCSLRYMSPIANGYSQLLSQPAYPIDEKKRRHNLSLVLLLITYTAAFLIPNLQDLLAFVGATGGVAMCFIIPTIFLLKVQDWQTGNVEVRTKIFTALLISSLGFICGSLQVFELFLDPNFGKGDHGTPLPSIPKEVPVPPPI